MFAILTHWVIDDVWIVFWFTVCGIAGCEIKVFLSCICIYAFDEELQYSWGLGDVAVA